MNLLRKPIPWMLASFLVAASVFGQTQPQTICTRPPIKSKPQPKNCPLQEPVEPKVCAYNAPAEINIGNQGDYDFFTSLSFIYWQPTQDNMNVAMVDDWSCALDALNGGFKGSFVEMDFDYKPGFKVGMGMNLQHDHWDGYAEYTRVHGRHSVHSNGSNNGPAFGSVFATRGHSYTLYNSQVFQSVNASFRNNLDFVDAEMGRKYYVGTNLLFRSAFGVRGAWILENLATHYQTQLTVATPYNYSQPPSSVAPSTVDVYSRSHSWAVGPRVGLTMDWVFGAGVRFFGSGYGDILYTKYNLKDKSVYTNVHGNTTSFITHDRVGVLRTHLDLEMGFGWGTYFDNNNWHFDLSAGYGMQVFFDQNMFREFQEHYVVGKNFAPNGNLYIQGLTVSARLDY